MFYYIAFDCTIQFAKQSRLALAAAVCRQTRSAVSKLAPLDGMTGFFEMNSCIRTQSPPLPRSYAMIRSKNRKRGPLG